MTSPNTTPIRLQKLIADAGVASRRAAERLILERRVRVNGKMVVELGTRVDPDQDEVMVNGRIIEPVARPHTYLAINKPAGVVTTARDPQGRPTVLNLVRSEARLYPAGRLDADSEGLLLLTDDGELTFRLTQARYQVEKEYHALVRCGPREIPVRKLQEGIQLEDGIARAVRASVLQQVAAGTWVRVVLHEGRNREVRRLLVAVGCPVIRLRRVRVGPLEIGTLRPGEYRPLRHHELEALREATGLDDSAPGEPHARSRRPSRRGTVRPRA